MLARAMASSVMVENDYETLEEQELFSEDEILKDWFEEK